MRVSSVITNTSFEGPAAGEGDVDAADVGRAVEDEEGPVDSAALGGVAGLGVGEFDVLADVGRGEADGAGPARDGECAAAVDGGR